MNLPAHLRLPARLAALAVVVFAIQVFSDNKADVDLWGNLGFVSAPAWTEAFPETNTFSFTEPGHPWINHEWLAQYLLHLTYTAGGAPALLLLKMALGFAVLGLAALKARRDGALGPAFLLFLLLVISTTGYGFSTRPHLFTYALYAGFLYLLTDPRPAAARRLALLPALGLLWTNLHGAFFIGIILLLALALLEPLHARCRFLPAPVPRRAPRLLLCAVAFGLLSLVNPYGPRVWIFITASAARLRPFLSEWAPFDVARDAADHADFMALALVSFAAVLAARRSRTLPVLGLLVLAFAAALFMRRNIPLFAITALFLAPPALEATAGPAVRRLAARLGPGVCSILLAGFILASALYGWGRNKTWPFALEVPHDRFPVEAVEFMRNHELSGNLLAFFDWAEYAIWKLYPDSRVFLDGRFMSAYSRQTIDAYFDFLYGSPDWARALDDYPTDILLLHGGNPSAEIMSVRRDWTLVYEDPLAVIFLNNARQAEALSRLQPVPHRPAAPGRAVSRFP
ncbi:MAG: hypothetical protein JW951_10120 [Lentisphaerae bacterium]|nr:hypothetical protein [Lentisphaerota bacterium]